VLGNQKSGTSAIAHLLADYGGLSKTVDIPESWWPTLKDLLSGTLRLVDFAQRYKHRFSSDLIKEPNFTFLYSQLKELHPKGAFVFIIRDPRDNIRSLLNRVGVPGNVESIEHASLRIPNNWRPLFDADLWALEAEHYIEILAARWNRAADVYLEYPDEMILIRYEDFVADKTGAIERLARDLGLPRVNDISDKVDIQYQQRGDRNVSWEEFFGAENLMRIERMCGGRMTKFGYELKVLAGL
jgi:hypothetical protein